METWKSLFGSKTHDKQNSRKLQVMLNDLQRMKLELVDDDPNKTNASTQKGDSYLEKKRQINGLLVGIRDKRERLTHLREKEERTATTIRLQMDVTTDLREVTRLFHALKEQLFKHERKLQKSNGKGKWTQAELDDRRKELTLLAEEIKQASFSASASAMSIEDRKLSDAVEQRRANNRLEREKRTNVRLASPKQERNGAREIDIFVDHDDDAPISSQEQVFLDQVQVNREAQNAMLQEIDQGLTQLLHMSKDANKSLVVQKAMLEQTETKMDDTIAQFKTANQRLQAIFDQAGGMTRWCPIMIGCVILLALIGYIWQMNK